MIIPPPVYEASSELASQAGIPTTSEKEQLDEGEVMATKVSFAALCSTSHLQVALHGLAEYALCSYAERLIHYPPLLVLLCSDQGDDASKASVTFVATDYKPKLCWQTSRRDFMSSSQLWACIDTTPTGQFFLLLPDI